MQNAADNKSPGTAGVLSALWPGLGHIYLGHFWIGLPLSIAAAAAAAFSYNVWDQVRWFGTNSFTPDQKSVIWIVFGMTLVLWLWCIWHAHLLALRASRAIHASHSERLTTAPVSAFDIGEDTWRAISGRRDKALLEEFIARFSDHPRVMMARLQLSELSGGTDANATASVTTSVSKPISQVERIDGAPIKASATIGHVAAKGDAVGGGSSIATLIAALVVVGAIGFGGWHYLEHQRRLDAIGTPEQAERSRVEQERAESERKKQEQAPMDVGRVRSGGPMGGSGWSDGSMLSASISASASQVVVGKEGVNISWSSSGATSCHVDGPNYHNATLSGSVHHSVSVITDPRVVYPNWIRFTIKCSNAQDTISDSVVVNVVVP